MKRTYTKKMHMYRLGQILQMQEPCYHCPASIKYRIFNSPGDLWKNNKKSYKPDPCIICWKFIKPDLSRRQIDTLGCPCTNLGANKALELTRKAFKREKAKAKI